MGKSKKQKQEWHYSRLDDEMTSSVAWKELSGNAVKLYIEFHKYGRSGCIFYKTYKDIEANLGYAPATCKKIIDELLKLGFIDLVSQGGITRREIDANNMTCWNKSTYKLSGRWKHIKFPTSKNEVNQLQKMKLRVT